MVIIVYHLDRNVINIVAVIYNRCELKFTVAIGNDTIKKLSRVKYALETNTHLTCAQKCSLTEKIVFNRKGYLS